MAAANDQPILSEVELIEQWRRSLPEEDQAVLAAFEEADRLADLDR